jgi:hypothetical protein
MASGENSKPFIQLLWSSKNHLRVGILETAVFGSDGKLKQWYLNSRSGIVKKKHAHTTSIFSLESHFVTYGLAGKCCCMIFRP